MGFNGSKHFSKNDLINYLESIGVKFGPDLNAYTSFDQTVYMLQVPTDKPEILSKAFLVLKDNILAIIKEHFDSITKNLPAAGTIVRSSNIASLGLIKWERLFH